MYWVLSITGAIRKIFYGSSPDFASDIKGI